MRRAQGMPAPLTSHQRSLYMAKRRAGSSQELAAAAAGISVRSARRIDNNALQPKAGQPRGRTRPDPLEQVWQSLLVPLLQREPALMPITLLEHLQQQKPDVDWVPYQRTLQRRVRDWKALHGPAPEVMFPLSYEPGEIAFCDFTQLKGVTVTIAGAALPHLLFHYRLAWSGWSFVQMVQGGESFVALSEGLQNALAACGGAPRELRTDRLSAACRNRDGSFAADITRRYHALCCHYGLAYSRNNRGVAHENGRVESAHGHLKKRIRQALLLRGNSDFESTVAYQEFLALVCEQYNRPRRSRLEQELTALRPLPPYRFVDYDIEQLKVRRTSTIEVRKVVYSVPPTLIGRQVTVRIHHDRLQILLGRTLACELTRIHGHGHERHGRAWSIDLDHLIDALRRKPRALLHCRYQRELFPDAAWWELWQQLRSSGDRDAAARLMVEALYVGCRLAGYEPVLQWLQSAKQRGRLSLAELQRRFRLPPHRPLPPQRIDQHVLASYDALLLHASASSGRGGAADPVAPAPLGAVPQPLAEPCLAS